MKIFFYNIEIFIYILDFLTLSCYKKANHVTISQAICLQLNFNDFVQDLLKNFVDIDLALEI